MKTTGGIPEYLEALAQFHRDASALKAWATRLGQPFISGVAATPKPEREPIRRATMRPKRKPTPRRRARAVASPELSLPLSIVSTSGQVNVPFVELSRPQACLAIMRHVGKPMTTEEVIKTAGDMGLDWEKVSGGPSNAVHGALWRERMKGNVRKSPKGPWSLVNPHLAPILDLTTRTAALSEENMPRQVIAKSRRQAMLKVLASGRMTPYEIMLAMREIPDFQSMPRHAVREDLEALIAVGKVEKTDRGLYRRAGA